MWSRICLPFCTAQIMLFVLRRKNIVALRARDFAESVGFEPTEGVSPRLVSSEVPSTAQPTLQYLS